MKKVTILLIIVFTGSAVCSLAGEDKGQPDPELVQQKINALGVRDDTRPYKQKPERWLSKRREKVMPELIEGLDSDKERIARGCLQLLKGAPKSETLLDALIRTAENRNSPIREATMLRLCQFTDVRRVKEVLRRALSESEHFTQETRARIAHALGKDRKAVELLVRLMKQEEDPYDIRQIFKRLVKIGHKSAVAPLEKMTKDERWDVASKAYFALAEIDPKQHSLTDAQRKFLLEANRHLKESNEHRKERWRRLSKLPRDEIRPLVLQMLNSDRPGPALTILKEWKDKDALSAIKEELQKRNQRDHWFYDFLTAYLYLEGTKKSIHKTLDGTFFKQKERPTFATQRDGSKSSSWKSVEIAEVWTDSAFKNFLKKISDSRMSTDRKLAFFKALRKKEGAERIAYSVASAICASVPAENFPGLVLPMMKQETDFGALAEYCEGLVEKDIGRHDLILDVLKKAANADAETVANNGGDIEQICELCAEAEIAESGPLADKLLTAEYEDLRFAAAHLSAVCGGDREQALTMLYRALGAEDEEFRQLASKHLLDIPCRNKAERKEREDAVLALPPNKQDYALRVLTTCAGQESIEYLLPELNKKDVQRVVHAAWVLAQIADGNVKQKAVRRLAIYAMFNRVMGQQSSGIAFNVAPNLGFYQQISSLNQKETDSDGSQLIPSELLQPFKMNRQEQRFAVRAYRYTRKPGRQIRGPRGRSRLLRFQVPSALPLLKVVAAEDPYLKAVHVQGKEVAHFPRRKTAAQTIAKITGEKTSYIGLAGEKIPSDEMRRQPYEDQKRLIAEFVLDRIESYAPDGNPSTDLERRIVDAQERLLSDLIRQFGEGLNQRILAEAEQRGLSERLKKAGYSLWRD